MRNAFSAVFIAAALTIAAVPALAHHSLFAVFDEEQTVTLKGVHVVERFRREGDVLAYSATVEDPVVFTGPWQTTPRTLRLQTAPGAALMESPPCIERSSPNMVTDDHH